MANKNGSSASLFERDIEVIGDINFSNTLYIHGKVSGNISAPMNSNAALYIQTGSQISGEIRAPAIVVAGKIHGDLFATRRISLKSTAEVIGNIHYTELQMEEGADINGILTCLNSNLPA
jgi:cytoskeletal protein CcmA (bactofilin family)